MPTFEVFSAKTGGFIGKVEADSQYKAIEEGFEKFGMPIKIGRRCADEQTNAIMTDPVESIQEGMRARAWRESAKLSRRKLAELTGYAESSIAAIERGEWGPDKPVDPMTFKTYRLTCAAVALGVIFDWERIHMSPLGRVVMSVPSAEMFKD